VAKASADEDQHSNSNRCSSKETATASVAYKEARVEVRLWQGLILLVLPLVLLFLLFWQLACRAIEREP
jgi:hypothetical protein